MHVIQGPPVSHHVLSNGVEFVLSNDFVFSVFVLEEDMIRVSLAQNDTAEQKSWMVVDATGDVPLSGRNKSDFSRFSTPVLISFSESPSPHTYVLSTSRLTVTIHLAQDLHLECLHVEHGLFFVDQPVGAYVLNANTFRHTVKRISESEEYYGFGETCGGLNKRGERIRMEGKDAMGYDAEKTDPLYKHWPYHFTRVNSSISYGLLYDTMRVCLFDLGKEISAFRGRYRYFETQGASSGLDYYLFTGRSPLELSKSLRLLIGPAILPPPWAMGYLASGMSYTEDNAHSLSKLRKFVSTLKKEDMLACCSGFHLSSGYTLQQGNRRCVFTWNPLLADNPSELFQALAPLAVIANVKPWLLESHPQFALAKPGYFSSSTSNKTEPSFGQFWAGDAGTSERGCYLDFTNPFAFRFWKDQIKETLLCHGCCAIWNDNNEYEVEDGDATIFNGKTVDNTGRALHTLLMARASQEALHEFFSQQQLPALVVSRSGSSGTHRYAAQTWSGDNSTSWKSLQFNTAMMLSLGLSGWPGSGCDVGGFAGESPTEELFWRWVQSGVFQPRFSIHSSMWKGGNNEPWMFPCKTRAIRQSLNIRQRLHIQLYSLFLEAYQTGFPVARALLFHYWEDDLARAESFQYTLGPNLLICPVYRPNQTEWSVYFPNSANQEVWFDLDALKWYRGGQRRTVLLCTVEQSQEAWFGGCPVFVKEGTGCVFNSLDKMERTVVCCFNDNQLCEVSWMETEWECTFQAHPSFKYKIQVKRRCPPERREKYAKMVPEFGSVKVIAFCRCGESADLCKSETVDLPISFIDEE